MNNYTIIVKELSEVAYIVRAESPEKAEELFEKWADSHQGWVADDLMDNSGGWEYSKPELAMMECEPDITYESLSE